MVQRLTRFSPVRFVVSMSSKYPKKRRHTPSNAIHAVAVQVAFERANLETGFSLYSLVTPGESG
jgi:hypothetical protein